MRTVSLQPPRAGGGGPAGEALLKWNRPCRQQAPRTPPAVRRRDGANGGHGSPALLTPPASRATACGGSLGAVRCCDRLERRPR